MHHLLDPRMALLSLLIIATSVGHAQQLPSEWYLDEDAHQLTQGSQPISGLYAPGIIRLVELQFSQPDHWDQLVANEASNTRMPATLIVDGTTYDSVGVRFKGSTSEEIELTQKRSFNISVNHYIAGQNVMGYTTLNLDNSSNDPSFLREVMYSNLIREHMPTPKAAHVQLRINGEDWGLYPNIQQLNSPFLREWFFSRNGSLWRAERPDGLAIGSFGDGTAALNYLGGDTVFYQTFYTLERTEQVLPWDHLLRVIDKLNNSDPTVLWDTLEQHLNVDRALWFLASEIAFSDRAGYVRKGKDDYMLYEEPESGRMTPLEMDGRSTMRMNGADWSAFRNANDANYPLLNKLLAVPELRQRYLAHLRTLIDTKLDGPTFSTLLLEKAALIDAAVESDPKKLYTYTEYLAEIDTLQLFIDTRRDFLLADPEVAQVAPVITDVEYGVAGENWAAPLATQAVEVRTTVNSTSGISAVRLYYSAGPHGRFTALPMFDDGQHNDGAAGDGIHGASIPPTPAMTRVRFYIEAAAGDTAQSLSYAPIGAEHDVYTYQVVHPMVPTPAVRINEVMALNTVTVMDSYGDYDDWIEFYNTTAQAFDLSDHWLSDNGNNLFKWRFPGGSIIQPGGYMIIWADDQTEQGDGHASFRLDVEGEEVWLSDPDGVVLDHVIFGPQVADMGYARVPNGTGPFVIQMPTFAASNGDGNSIAEWSAADALQVFPNPAAQQLFLHSSSPLEVVVFDALQRRVWEGRTNGRTAIDISAWAAGTYFVHHTGGVQKVVVMR